MTAGADFRANSKSFVYNAEKIVATYSGTFNADEALPTRYFTLQGHNRHGSAEWNLHCHHSRDVRTRLRSSKRIADVNPLPLLRRRSRGQGSSCLDQGRGRSCC